MEQMYTGAFIVLIKRYLRYFRDVPKKPARITIGSQLLSVLVEMEAIAYIKKR